MMRLRLLRVSVSPKWVPLIWGAGFVRAQIERIAKTTAGIWKIAQPDLARITIPIPPEFEQEAIVEAVEDQLSVIDHLEADIHAKLKKSQSLRQSILRHAFTGRLVPQDPNDEPAAELLKRIAVEREAWAHDAAVTKRVGKETRGTRNGRRGRPRKPKVAGN